MTEILSTASIGAGDVAVRLLLAMALGATIGLDRELRAKPLGLRSFILVSVGAALFSLVNAELIAELDGREGLAVDPGRVIQGIVQGIGFLGAGAVIQARGDIVVGGTTGATIWAVGGVGIACGFGFYLHAVLATAIVLFVLTVLGFVERWFGKDDASDGGGRGGDGGGRR